MSSNQDESDRFHKKYLKENKRERKQKQALDRSKYKKTDLHKHPKKHIQEKASSEGALEGLVVRVVSRGFIIESEGHEIFASLKGSLKEKVFEDANLVAIGDHVSLVLNEDGSGRIDSVFPRKSALVREDSLVKGKKQFLAANVDQVLICGSLVDPPLKPTLIDRYIIAAKKGGISPIVVINKCDLLEQSEREKTLFEGLLEAYKLAGIPLVALSAHTKQGLDQLKKIMEGKISVFSGQSGVGKSSLINALLGLDLAVGETTKMKKGSHTTTHPILLRLTPSGYCIDTPGIKSFSVWSISEAPMDEYFDEIKKYKEGCRFRDCRHSGEEGCHVVKMVEAGKISPLRYDSYLSLVQETGERSRRR